MTARSRLLVCWDCWFEFRRGQGCLPLVSVVCCQVEDSATGRSPVQRSPPACVNMSLIVTRCNNMSLIVTRCNNMSLIVTQVQQYVTDCDQVEQYVTDCDQVQQYVTDCDQVQQ